MRLHALWLAFLLATSIALPVSAQDEPGVDEPKSMVETPSEASGPVMEEPLAPEVREDPVIEEALVPEEEEEEDALSEYGAAVLNRYEIGLNSLITFPADPVMSTVHPDAEWDELPLSVVTKYPVGLVQGTLLMTYRAAGGFFDVLMAPVTPMKMVSPEPRYLLFENAEHEEY